jgi:2-amino-4-hydroxy-6-hydroxymethyldihydropteridine diphosphokinase
MNLLVLGLGGNIGDVKETFLIAEQFLNEEVGLTRSKSSNYKTSAWGNTNQPDFLNMVMILETKEDVETCLKKVLSIEQKLGRIRTNQKWVERTIDIDILFYNQIMLEKDDLKVPHPYLHERKFVLTPLNEVAPKFIHPKFNTTIEMLLENCTDVLDVQKV